MISILDDSPHHTRRITGGDTAWRHILRNHGASSDNRPIANCDIRQDYRMLTNPYAITDSDWPFRIKRSIIRRHSLLLRTRIPMRMIGDEHIPPHKDIVTERNRINSSDVSIACDSTAVSKRNPRRESLFAV